MLFKNSARQQAFCQKGPNAKLATNIYADLINPMKFITFCHEYEYSDSTIESLNISSKWGQSWALELFIIFWLVTKQRYSNILWDILDSFFLLYNYSSSDHSLKGKRRDPGKCSKGWSICLQLQEPQVPIPNWNFPKWLQSTTLPQEHHQVWHPHLPE